jgi:dTDP-D-glucose 4,6-dehydratase
LVNAWNHNYGPWRFPEKPMLLYGDGRNVRGWLNVEDHAEDALLSAGAPHNRLITPVTDRPDRDRRYAVDPPASARSWAGGRAKALRRGCSGGRLGVLAGAGAN